MSKELTAWLTAELNRLNWSHAQLAKKAGVSRAAVSNTLRGEIPPSCEFCIKIAGALDVAPEYSLRLAGILPGEPSPISPSPTTLEIMQLAESLPPEQRQEALRYLRYLAQQQGE